MLLTAALLLVESSLSIHPLCGTSNVAHDLECRACSTNKEVMNTLKRRWLEAGQPHQHADWTELLKDL